MKSIIGKKVGMTQFFASDGKVTPATVIDVSKARYTKIINDKKVEIGFGSTKHPSKSELGIYKDKLLVPRKREVVEIPEGFDEANISLNIDPSIFAPGDEVKATGLRKGKGFQGGVKRWGFAGGPRTHGQSDRERAPGSLGTRTIPGRVFKGKKMAGHMGTTVQTILGLKILKVDAENGMILVSGSVPGFKGSYILVRSVL